MDQLVGAQRAVAKPDDGWPPFTTGRRELLFIAIIIVLGIIAAAALVEASTRLQKLSNLMQHYQSACERIARNVKHLVENRDDTQMTIPVASFVLDRVSENLDRTASLQREIDNQLNEISAPITRGLASLSLTSIAVLRNNNDTKALRDFADKLVKAPRDQIGAAVSTIDKDLAISLKYGDYLDDLHNRVSFASELSQRGTQPLFMLLLTIGASVMLGIWAVWLRALKPGIAALQASNAALADASSTLQEQNRAYVRREIESLAAQRIAKFGYWVVKDAGEPQCSEGLIHMLDSGTPRTLQQLASIGTRSDYIGVQMESDIYSGYQELSQKDGAREFTRVVRSASGADRIIRERVESSVEPATSSRYMIGIMLDVSELAHAQSRAARADKLESIGVLTGVVAHDFNNVLALLKASIDLIELRPQTLPTRLAAMRRGVDNATTLITRLGTIGRGESDEQTLLDLKQLLPEAVKLFQSNALNTATVILDIADGDTQIIKIDHSKFENALLNLLVNASEATAGRNDALIKLSSRIEIDPLVQARDEQRLYGEFVRIEVSDNGPGMSLDVLRRAVDPFFSTKAHHAAAPRGLGLWSVYQTVRGARGALSITSNEGLGTSIVMHFPRLAVELPKAPRRTKPDLDAPRTPARLLIVDDAEDLLEALNEQLLAAGYETHTASNIAAALEALERDRSIQIVVSDVNLRHGETGLQLATHIRSSYPDKKIVFISGYPITPTGSGLHPDIAVLKKPIDIEALDVEIQRLLHA